MAGALVLVLCLFGIREYAKVVEAVYPLGQWLFWPLAMLWGWVGLFSLACASFGHWLLWRALKLRQLPALEAAVFSMALGVVSFVLAMYVGGALACFNPVFAVALPLVMVSIGAKDGARLVRSVIADVQRSTRSGPWEFVLSAAGIVCVAVIYLGAMTPDSLNYDSTWCHLTVAQDYARAGRIVPFPADYTKNVPQLASLIHTWGWLLPGLDTPLRWMLVLHNEFALFVWTLVGVAAGIRRLVGNRALRGAWATFFLFPVIFVYDNNLGGAADHICAFFSVPILLATLQVCVGFSPASSALLGIVSAGALLTKYQAAYLMLPIALILATTLSWRLFEHRAARGTTGTPRIPVRQLLASPLWIAGFGALCVSPHFIRQAIFHHNPIYPFGQDLFTHSKPTLPNAAFMFTQTISDPNWYPRGTLSERFVHASKLFLQFSFTPHYSFTRNVPAFGSLFTLLLPALLVLRDRTRLWIAAIIASSAVFIWALVYNVDRNLQVFMPVMVCVTGALIVEVWRLGWLARLGLVPLVAFQIVWGGDALFYSSHPRIDNAIDLITSGYDGRAGSRFASYRSDYLAIGAALPPNARVLLHTSHVSLGIDREVLLDWHGYQSLISYDHVHTPRELFDYYRSLGITHLLYAPGARPAGTRQEEVLWNAFVKRYAKALGQFGGYHLLALPENPPPVEPPYRVAALGMPGYADGIYPIDAMTTGEYLMPEHKKYRKPATALPSQAESRDTLINSVDAVLLGPSQPESPAMRRRFSIALEMPRQFTLLLRNPG